MVRKITPPTLGGWHKRLGFFDPRGPAAKRSPQTTASRWDSDAWWHDLARQLADRVLSGRDLHPPLAAGVREAIAQIVHLEAAALHVPPAQPSGVAEAVAHRALLRARASFDADADVLLHEWLEALARVFAPFVDAAPVRAEVADGTFTVPFLDRIPNLVGLITQLFGELMRFAADDTDAARPGAVLARRVQQNLLDLSKLTEDAARKNPYRLTSPADSGLEGAELVTAYLARTPLIEFLQIPTPFPLTARFSRHHIVATPGAGKTNLIGVLLAQDLNEVERGRSSVIVLDSQGDLITSIVRHRDFAPGGRLHHRLVYIDPTDIEYPLELNFFARRGNRARTLLEKQTEHADLVNLLLFLFGAMKQEATGRQETLIKAVASLIQEIPDATLATLNAIFEPVDKKRPALPKFEAYLPRLDEAVREFFAVDFLSAEFSQTRAQMRARVQSLITDPIFRAMFGATSQKLDFAAEMNSGKVILINAYEDLLKEGTEVFGRFFIALAAQAAQARQNIPERERLPTYLYIDECYKFIKADTNVATILDTGRKYRLGVIIAHQRLGQLSDALKSAASGAAIKMVRAPIHDDARVLAYQLNTTPEYFDALPDHAFATRITGMRRPVALTTPLSPFATAEHMTDAEFAEVRNVMRRKYARVSDRHAAPQHRAIGAQQLNSPPREPTAHPPAAPTSTATGARNLPDPLLKPGKDW